MVLYISLGLLTAAMMVVLGFFLGSRGKGSQTNSAELIDNLRSRLTEQDERAKGLETTLHSQTEQIKALTSERDVQKAHTDNYCALLASQKSDFEKQMREQKEASEIAYQRQLNILKENAEQALQTERERNATREAELKTSFEKQTTDLKASYEKQIAEIKQEAENYQQKQKADAEEFRHSEAQRYADAIANMKNAYETQITELKSSHDRQLNQTKENSLKQIETLKLMNHEQVESQLKLIREQMQTTSEEVLKRRQEELDERNREQVSKVIDPLKQSLKDMQEAFDKTKEQQSEALTRLDETIKINMQKSAALGETADRLTRALTGEVKVQGNFGELKLKQLLEDLELKEGEQFDTQETLKDKAGNSAKGDDGRGLIPDFILHFPNNRHVVVDSKMSLTDYERYMNAEDGTPEKNEYLKSHIASVRAQVKRLAKKEYTKYLPNGYNKLNFAIMYMPIEGALNLALLNDDTLWRDAYDQGVMILGPQTMYMNLRVLEMMWTQVRQLKNQQAMMDAANMVIDRVQDFGMRFIDVETSMNDTVRKITKLKITTADSGASIITAAKKLLKAGAQENKKKKSLNELDDSTFLDDDNTLMLTDKKEEA